MWHVACATNHLLLGAMGHLGLPCESSPSINLCLTYFEGHILVKNHGQHIQQYRVFKSWDKLCPLFQTRIHYSFNPIFFVITGKLTSTAFCWLFGFCQHQLKKWFVWNNGQGLVYSSPIVLMVCIGLNLQKNCINAGMMLFQSASRIITPSTIW